MPAEWIAGADGFKSRWFVILQNRHTKELRRGIVPAFADLLSLDEASSVVCVDIPIGLPRFATPGGRECERQARRVLSRRASSVFSAGGREALSQPTRLGADVVSRQAGGLGVGAQAWGIAKKLLEADAAMTADAQRFVSRCIRRFISGLCGRRAKQIAVDWGCARTDRSTRTVHPPSFHVDHLLSEWPDCRLEAQCPRCGRAAFVPVRMLRSRTATRASGGC